MSQNFLAYWKPETADLNLKHGGLLEHSASEQYKRVKVGDIVWIVSVYSGSLHLLGNIIVGFVTNQTKAAEMLGTTDLWESSHHIVATKDTAQPIRNIPIDHLAERLRFKSPSGSDRLVMTDGRVRAQQLQTMRVLDADSAFLLESELHTEMRTGHVGRKETSSSKTPSANADSSLKQREESVQLTTREEKAPLVNRQAMLESLRLLHTAADKSHDLLKSAHRYLDRSEIPYDGFCYIISECMFHLFPGEFVPYRQAHDYGSHWFLRLCSDGSIFEPNMKNAVKMPGHNYNKNARRRNKFLRSHLSERASQLLERAGLSLPSKAA